MTDNRYSVSILTKNRDTHKLEKSSLGFTEFCYNVGYSLKCVLNEVEKEFIKTYGTNRTNWSEQTILDFSRIRSRLLDAANNVERLPTTLCYNGKSINTLSGGEYVAKMTGQ